MEQVIKMNTMVATNVSDNDIHKISRLLIDHFSTSNSWYIRKIYVIETGMVDHLLIYCIMKINALQIKAQFLNVVKFQSVHVQLKHRYHL